MASVHAQAQRARRVVHTARDLVFRVLARLDQMMEATSERDAPSLFEYGSGQIRVYVSLQGQFPRGPVIGM